MAFNVIILLLLFILEIEKKKLNPIKILPSFYPRNEPNQKENKTTTTKRMPKRRRHARNQ